MVITGHVPERAVSAQLVDFTYGRVPCLVELHRLIQQKASGIIGSTNYSHISVFQLGVFGSIEKRREGEKAGQIAKKFRYSFVPAEPLQ
jgi:hypothetical protein